MENPFGEYVEITKKGESKYILFKLKLLHQLIKVDGVDKFIIIDVD